MTNHLPIVVTSSIVNITILFQPKAFVVTVAVDIKIVLEEIRVERSAIVPIPIAIALSGIVAVQLVWIVHAKSDVSSKHF